jgi:phospholipid/cholesterol/gamma-HCH transport system substrate-binding protein
MNRRIVINLIAFAVLGVVLTVWAVSNIVSFDYLEKPYRVTAAFQTSPGLSPDFEVTYLGHKIGAIDSVKLRRGHVDVVLRIDRDVELPRELSAAVRRKSAVGEPYVDLARREPSGAQPEKTAGGRLREGDRIPIEHTTIPLSYTNLFEAVDRLVKAIDPADLKTVLHELAVGVEGRDRSIRDFVRGTDQLTADFAAKGELLESALTELSRFTHTVAGHTGAIGSSFDNLAALGAGLTEARQSITALLERGPDFGSRVADLLAKTRADFGCTFEALGGLASRIDDDALAHLERAIANGAPLEHVITDTRDTDEADGPFQQGKAKINFGQPLPVNSPPLAAPTIPPLPTCTASTAGGGGGAGAKAATGTAASVVPPSFAPRPGEGPGAPPEAAPPPAESTSKSVGDGGMDWLPTAGLVALAALFAATRPWRLLRLIPLAFGRRPGG